MAEPERTTQTEKAAPPVNVVAAAFDRRADFYGRTRSGDPAFLGEMQEVMSLLRRPPTRILEVGCGPGIAAHHLIERGWTVVASDLSMEMLHRTRSFLGASSALAGLVRCDAQRLPFREGSAPAVLCHGVLEYVPDVPRAIREMASVVEPGGSLIVTMPNRLSPASWTASALGLVARVGHELRGRRVARLPIRHQFPWRMDRLARAAGLSKRNGMPQTFAFLPTDLFPHRWLSWNNRVTEALPRTWLFRWWGFQYVASYEHPATGPEPRAAAPTPICLVIGSLERCGTAVHLHAFLRNLDRTRYLPWVVVAVKTGPLEDSITALGIEVHRLGIRSIYSWRMLRSLVWLAGRIRRTKTQVVQSYLFFDNLLGPLAARLGGARAVITGRRTVDEWESPLHHRIYRLTSPLVDRIAVVSEQVGDSVRKWERPPEGKVVVIPNAQSKETLTGRSNPAEDALLADLDRRVAGGFVFGTVGNSRPIKGHDVLIRAFERVVRAHPECHLVLVGEIYPGPPHIESMVVTLGLSASVHFVGYRANVAGYLERFDAFVLSSLAEGMSNALLEALLLGKPAVSTRFGLPPSVDGGDVVLPVPPGDAEALAGAMERLVTDAALRETLSNRARAFAESAMDEPGMTRQYESLYEELVGGRKRRFRSEEKRRSR